MGLRKNRSILLNRWFLLGVIIAGTVLRYHWIVPMHPWATAQQFEERYAYSDMGIYWLQAKNISTPDYHWIPADKSYPPGMSYLIALVVGPHMDRIAAFQAVQLIFSFLILIGTGFLASELFGKRAGAFALIGAALAFPLFDYSAYPLAETPFTLTLLLASVCAALYWKKRSTAWLVLSGVLYGLSATFKTVGLLAGLLFIPLLLSSALFPRLKHRLRQVVIFVLSLAVFVIPASVIMTQRNGGEFTLLSNDTLRIAIANHGDVLGADLIYPDGGVYEVRSPLSYQRNFTEMRTLYVGRDNVLLENARWIVEHPLKAFTGWVQRNIDLFYGTLPFPTYWTRFRSLTELSQILMLVLVYFPAGIWIYGTFRDGTRLDKQRTALLLYPLLSLFLVAIIAATEPRYLHPFAPLLIAMAGAWYAGKLKSTLPAPR